MPRYIQPSAMALKHLGKKIALLSPVSSRTPPRQFGAIESVVHTLVEGLVQSGWDVTLFATADSQTTAVLDSVVPTGFTDDHRLDARLVETAHVAHCFDRAKEFALIHAHVDYAALPMAAQVETPALFTLHGFSSPDVAAFTRRYSGRVDFISLSDADRDPFIDYAATVYDGIDLSAISFFENAGEDLVFLGRIDPEKSPHLAAEVAKKTGRKLLIAGPITNGAYFDKKLRPLIDGRRIVYLGPVGPTERTEIFRRAAAVLQLNEVPERFGLVLAEANAAGIPVIAMDRGSCREVIEDGKTGFLVKSVDEAVKALSKIGEISRFHCRERVEQRFSMGAMVEAYERVYDRILLRARG